MWRSHDHGHPPLTLCLPPAFHHSMSCQTAMLAMLLVGSKRGCSETNRAALNVLQVRTAEFMVHFKPEVLLNSASAECFVQSTIKVVADMHAGVYMQNDVYNGM